jgi:hypothetical protein
MREHSSVKRRALCISARSKLPHFLLNGQYDVVQLRDPALGINRLGLEDFDLIVVDEGVASPPAMQIMFDFLQRQHLDFSRWPVDELEPSRGHALVFH